MSTKDKNHSPLTQNQRDRMQQNRIRALALLAKKRKSETETESPSRPSKRRREDAPLTLQQKTRILQNRQRALDIKAGKKTADGEKKQGNPPSIKIRQNNPVIHDLSSSPSFSSSGSSSRTASSSSSSGSSSRTAITVADESADFVVSAAELTQSLDPHQLDCVIRAMEGKNLLILGSPGTGKSYLATIIAYLCELQRTTTTIKSADVLNSQIQSLPLNEACTMYSWLGLGLFKDTIKNHITQIRMRPKILFRWTALKSGIIIDEVSMLKAEQLLKLHKIACILRKNSLPMGGMQFVLFGDFEQLPPFESRPGKTFRFLFESDFI